jgi:transcriptional regulator with XRE-family HTH domain
MTEVMAKQESGFGRRLRLLRLAAGLTQQELAMRAGLHISTETKIEQEVQEPTWPKVVALARALGVSVAAFDEPPGDAPAGESDAGDSKKPRRRK